MKPLGGYSIVIQLLLSSYWRLVTEDWRLIPAIIPATATNHVLSSQLQTQNWSGCLKTKFNHLPLTVPSGYSSFPRRRISEEIRINSALHFNTLYEINQ